MATLVNKGFLKAYLRNTDQVIGIWPVSLNKNEHGRYFISAPIFDAVSAEPKFFTNAADARQSMCDGNEWLYIWVEWLT